MPHVQITLLAGRTTEQKRRVVERVTQVLTEEIGSFADSISVAFIDVPRDSFARGGVLVLDTLPAKP